ncbi:hypothetical protein AM10699_22790 [Acaryochloris marina MBIC10699]|nr:hypothetical protein AM10699_22790 [Acaryochloris marina MBIC10699]
MSFFLIKKQLKKHTDAEIHQHKIPILEATPTKGFVVAWIKELSPLEPAITAGSLKKTFIGIFVFSLAITISNSRISAGMYIFSFFKVEGIV